MSMVNFPTNGLNQLYAPKGRIGTVIIYLNTKFPCINKKSKTQTVTYNCDNSLICTINYPIKISAKAGIQGSW